MSNVVFYIYEILLSQWSIVEKKNQHSRLLVSERSDESDDLYDKSKF